MHIWVYNLLYLACSTEWWRSLSFLTFKVDTHPVSCYKLVLFKDLHRILNLLQQCSWPSYCTSHKRRITNKRWALLCLRIDKPSYCQYSACLIHNVSHKPLTSHSKKQWSMPFNHEQNLMEINHSKWIYM